MDSNDEIESEGVRRARQAAERCDLILLIIDITDPGAAAAARQQLATAIPVLHVVNKIDLWDRPVPGSIPGDSVLVSAKTGSGLDDLRERIRATCALGPATDNSFTARRRHIDALAQARRHTLAARRHIAAPMAELAAEELRLAQQSLGEITGEFTSDELLGSIFRSFCIGK